MKRLLVVALGLGSLVAANASLADTITWDFTCSSNCNPNTSAYGNNRSFTGSDASSTVDVGAMANTGGNGNITIQDAYLAAWDGGLGAYNRDRSAGNDSDATNDVDSNEGNAPEHALDNNGRYEMALFTFAQMTELTGLEIGWKGDDSDMSVLAWTGPGAPPSTTGMGWGDLIGAGWSLVGQYADLVTGSWQNINAAGYASRYWLVGAHNPVFGGDAFSTGNDYIKISGLTGHSVTVDEPLALTLMALGLAGLAARRKRAA
ncbi:PEP-CTERM sorting domain-containing protein [Permianibacter sp. IMCC34836]|uniref:exosortase-dependent surface protein XDP1 n=1 Tax=Permianibacter fluminis TaxID=2738515 RepID=UPI00155715C4|nr:exosortase-dependent surface protein XDP1 [Permianibacter fluminis]NQD35869.1 PEP-CTERM sorting domain-containing protein [Permianibacter fluminis]